MLAFLKSWPKVLDHIEDFDYENVSGPQHTMMKKAQLVSIDDMRNKSLVGVGVANLLIKVQNYYIAKQQAIDLLQSKM